ncbi:hepatitis A virus cellular receptor 1 homolog [Epinephelus moara]|uniref:hepatitis A virus cellular receptor 1 homolog n=1 Tax=Epinephelus moara TaxID=300413 RepID=UPI00214F135D|nr:hepatitis A virus cellular receptor 1 homolog [Epinephelus moara]
MLLLLHTFTCVCVLTAGVSAVTTETVVGVAGRRVTLPCRSEAVGQKGVDVCWGRGEPSLFTCHNTVINTAGDQVLYRKSYRYSSSSSSSSLTIINSRPSDSGFYHCRVQLPGLFNDQTSTVHLIIINPRSVVSDSSDGRDTVTLNTPHTAGYDTRDMTEVTGSDVTGEDTTGPMVALVQSSVQQQGNSLQSFIGNTVRVSFIIFIPALLLTAAYKVRRSETVRRLDQSEEEQEEAGSSV